MKKDNVTALTPVAKTKNKKVLKRINKAITRLEKQVTRILLISQKLQTLKASYTEKKAA